MFPRQYFHTSHFSVHSLNMTSQILDAIAYVKKLPKEPKIPVLLIFSSSLKPQAWLFLYLCLLCPSTWWKTETFTSPTLYFHLSSTTQNSDFSTVYVPAIPLLPLHGYQEKKPQEGQECSPLCSWPWYHDDPWLQEGEILETFLSVGGLEALRQLVRPNQVPTVMCNVVFQQHIIQLNFSKTLWKAYSRDHGYLTKFDLLLQRLKQNQCLNNWIVKVSFLFPSQIDPVLTHVFKKYSVCDRPSTKKFQYERMIIKHRITFVVGIATCTLVLPENMNLHFFFLK